MKRRDFVRTTGAAAAGCLMSTSLMAAQRNGNIRASRSLTSIPMMRSIPTAIVLIALFRTQLSAAPPPKAQGVPATSAGKDVLDTCQDIQRQILQERYIDRSWKARLANAGVCLGPWYRIGPFRDLPPDLNWVKNTQSSFAHVFDVERDTLAGNAPLLERDYKAANFPATPNAIRRWTAHPEWVDGYLCDLPRGQAPSAGESQYVYREIHTKKPIEVLLDFRVRAPEESWQPGWRRYWKDRESWKYRARFRCFLNGEPVQVREGKTDTPPQVKLKLEPGVNHFLAKITNNRHSYGFSFAITGLHPKPETSAMDGKATSWFKPYPATEQPWFREGQVESPKIPKAPQLYRETLMRLVDLRFAMTPMPGIESGVRDEDGSVITPMEKSLQSYPNSEEGIRYRASLRELERDVSNLLDRIVDEDNPHYEDVLALGEKLEAHWAETIRRLPEILFLERPRYAHDSMQYTKSGASPSSIRAFHPASRRLRTIYNAPELKAHDINLSWDARTVFIGGGGTVSRVSIDGQEFKSITTGQSPAELPSGRIVFFDDAPGMSPCKAGAPRRLLFTVDRNGRERRLVSANLTIDNHPQVTADGRVVFARWDYGVNKDVFSRHGIWMQNPDGTAIDLYFGNTIIDPFAFYRPRQIPGRPELVCIMGSHHHNNAGLVGLIWNGMGPEAGDGVGFQRITHDTASIADLSSPEQFQDPYPLNEQLFLVSYAGHRDRPTGIYLLDRYGNRKCLFEPANNLAAVCPQPLAPRDRPPVIPDRTTTVQWKPEDMRNRLFTDPDWSQTGLLVLQDVYQGLEPEIERGQVAYLAVMEQVPETRARGGGMGVGAFFYVNRLIGLVPVEKDGSAHFEVPALRSLYLHVLDKDGKMLMTQGSDFHVMPGERRGCIGCHEQRKNVQSPSVGATLMALTKPPVRPQPAGWGTRGIIEYESVVQPVFDKHCVSCHGGATPQGQLNLSGDRTTVFNMSYMELVDKGLVHFMPGKGRTYMQLNADYDQQAPLSRGSVLSTLTRYIDDPNHGNTPLTAEEKRRIFLWIDSNIPFYGHYDQDSPTVLSEDARTTLKAGYDRRCASCHDKELRPDTPDFLDDYSIEVHRGPRPGQWGITKSGMRVRHLNLSRPETSAALQAPLATDAGGWGLCVGENAGAVFNDKTDPDYREILQVLKTGVIKRHEPGVLELLESRAHEADAAHAGQREARTSN